MPKYGKPESVRAGRMRRRIRIRKYIEKYKEGKSCGFCGWEEHPEILQFHHHKGQKEIKLSSAAKWNLSEKRIDEEIEKCLLLCPNCHMWHHYKERKDGDLPKV